jgi:pyruvate kinase
MDRATKIVATIGPACREDPILTDLLLAGVNVARLNFSHGTHQSHSETISRLKERRKALDSSISILQDLQGPKFRIGELSRNILLDPGDQFTLSTREASNNDQFIPVDFPEITQCVFPGSRILIDDGTIELSVLSVSEPDIETVVVTGGILQSNKGINLPGAKVPISALTEKDIADLEFGLALGVDAIALSFVQTPQDIFDCRNAVIRIASDRRDIPIIAKLERPEALDNLEAIVAASDGVMVARGDLGVEMNPEHVPIAQKRIIECANKQGKLVITATQMLDSMINNPRPTRAEASDVANAILDGTDAVMLSGETAAGKYPLRSVQTMDAIICQAERHMETWGRGFVLPHPVTGTDDAYYIVQAARALASDRNVAAIAVFTHSGRTARLMAKMRPDVPIFAFTSVESVFHQLPMYWGVRPHLVPHATSIEDMLDAVDHTLTECTSIQYGQQVVLICGYPVEGGVPANLALLHTVGRDKY